jgi:hypothetical protein
MLGAGAKDAALRPVFEPTEDDKEALGERTRKVYDHLDAFFGRIYGSTGVTSSRTAGNASDGILKEYEHFSKAWPADGSRPTLTDLPDALTAWIPSIRAVDASMSLPHRSERR